MVDHKGDKADLSAAGVAYATAFPNLSSNNVYTGYELARDLNFRNAGSYASGTVNTDWTGSAGWELVGTNANPFSGTFDGGGNVIDSFFINGGVLPWLVWGCIRYYHEYRHYTCKGDGRR
ncbi:MAG: hypothetical protein OXH57_08815 [Ekhidna sp.]|nr:hypothetical protein [Ekhidna sp.]